VSLDDELNVFLDKALSTGKSTVIIAMADLFFAVLEKPEEEEHTYPIPDSVLRRSIPLSLMGTRKGSRLWNVSASWQRSSIASSLLTVTFSSFTQWAGLPITMYLANRAMWRVGRSGMPRNLNLSKPGNVENRSTLLLVKLDVRR
jgi:hypothetical protein